MDRLQELKNKMARSHYAKTKLYNSALAFLDSGDLKDLEPWTSASYDEIREEYWTPGYSDFSQDPDNWGEAERRLAHLIVASRDYYNIGPLLFPHTFAEEKKLSPLERYKVAIKAAHRLQSFGIAKPILIAGMLKNGFDYCQYGKQPVPKFPAGIQIKASSITRASFERRIAIISLLQKTVVEEYILACTDEELVQALEFDREAVGPLTFFLATSAPQRLDSLITSGALNKPMANASSFESHCGAVAMPIIAGYGTKYEKQLLDTLKICRGDETSFEIAWALLEIDAKRHRHTLLLALEKCLCQENHMNEDGVVHVHKSVETLGHEGMAFIEKLTREKKIQHHNAPWICDALSRIGPTAIDAALLCVEFTPKVDENDKYYNHEWHMSRWVGMIVLLPSFSSPKNDSRIVDAIKSSFKIVEFPKLLVTCIKTAAKIGAAHFETELWQLLDNKSKLVRNAAAGALAKLGDPAIPKASECLKSKKADLRCAAALLLGRVGSDAALAVLEKSVDDETNDDVRDLMLMGLLDAWEKQGRKPTRKDVTKQIKRLGDKLKSPPDWVKLDKIPKPYWADGKAFSNDEISYLIYRQSRAAGVLPDIEARAVYALADREKSGSFARAILEGFFATKQESSDRWALTVAAMLGEDTLVPLVVSQIKTWVDTNRGKLAEYAVQALALMGTDRALMAVDTLSIRYRSKMKNVGKAAVEAFELAADRRGLTVHELGDKVVPWLCFEPGKPLVLEAGAVKVMVKVGTDLKLAFTDMVKNKPMKTLPAALGKEVVAQMKEHAVELREAVKAQTIRLEALLVMQRRWDAAPWQELFLKHPILLPMSTRLVWAEYDKAGKLKATFRPLEDGTLTTNEDETYALSKNSIVGIVHPLELSQKDREAWSEHVSDYEVEPPFAQIERPVIAVKDAEKELKTYMGVDKKTVNGMSFKGRADKLGWRRGSVVDGGGVESYVKVFGALGVEAYLAIDGMYMGMGVEDQVTLGQLVFAKAGTVKTGSYVYDFPQEKDERTFKLGEVPEIAYSETIGDLTKIAGGEKAEGEAAE